uniref:Uncharacterized protein n=1 Tax=Thermodesulfobacterium geofontis TaxID=1295609 RepID=A0A7C4NTU9_9BACT
MEEKKQKIIVIKKGKENKEQRSQARQIQNLSWDQFLKDIKIVIQTRRALITGIFCSIVNDFFSFRKC